jgi:cytochrome c oxidase cbb3-type subunit III
MIRKTIHRLGALSALGHLFLFLLASGGAFAQIDGQKIFKDNCAMCHSLDSRVVGPALGDVHDRRDEKWIRSFISNSGQMIASGDETAKKLFEEYGKVAMPAYQNTLSEEQLTAVVGYLKTGNQAAAAAPVATGQQQGNQQAAATAAPEPFVWSKLPPELLIISGIIGLIFFLILVYIAIILSEFMPAAKETYEQPAHANSPVGKLVGLFSGDTTALTGKYADVVIEGHDYDGIHEFDNDLPPWWKYLFYATIVFSGVYLLHYHVFQSGLLQDEEYQFEMEQAALLHPNLLIGGDGAEEINFTALTDAVALESGHSLYMQNCAACHGQNGEGTIGPNLADEYWLHGGDINSIFKVIKYGVTSKGMVAWQGKLSQNQMLEVSSYILSLQGTNPEGGKGPQGEKL